MTNSFFVERPSCPACASNKTRVIYKNEFDTSPIKEYLVNFYSPQGGVEFKYLEGALYILCECSMCGLIFQKEVPNDDLMQRLYEYWIDPEKVFNEQQIQDGLDISFYYAQEIMQLITYFRKAPSDLRFFDFGMGWGKWGLMAKAFGCDSCGSEISEARIKFAISNGIKVIPWENIPDQQFDFINTEQVFEHIPNPLQTLIHLKKALKPGGLLKISVPTANDIDRRLKIMDWQAPKYSAHSLNPVAPLEHINHFRRKSITRMASLAGMKEIFIPMKEQYQFTTGWVGFRRISKNLLLPIYRNVLKKQNYLLFRNKDDKYRLNNLGSGGCACGSAARTPPSSPFLLRSYDDNNL